jgi:endonuclease YncB( thermonuclease family)
MDGDTLVVDIEGGGRRQFRLAWVDAPDLRQPQGEFSRASLTALAAARPALVEPVGEGKGGVQAVVRVTPPEVRCPTGDCPRTLDLGHAQLSRGLAWHDRRSLGQPTQSLGQYEHAEFEAKVRRIGLWADRNPTPPWDWRPR